MKVALACQKFQPPLVGGVDMYTERLARAFDRAGHRPQILATDAGGEGGAGYTVSASEQQGWPVRRIRFSLAERSRDTFDRAYDPTLVSAFREALQELAPDVFIILNFYQPTFAAVEAAAELRIPVLHIATDFVPVCRRGTFIRWNGAACTVGESVKTCAACYVSHRPLGRLGATALGLLPEATLVAWARGAGGGAPSHPLRPFDPYLRQVRVTHERLDLLALQRRRIQKVFVPTRYTERVFLENGFGADQVRYMPFGVEEDGPMARVRKEPSEVTRFLFVGRVQPYKGAHVLVDAFESLRTAMGARLQIYGKADGYDAYFERLMRRIEANDAIDFGGQIDPAELERAFARADYFILPSLWHENSPLILLDALQSSTPVIASRVGGVTDLVEHGVNGMLFPMGDAGALRDLLQQAIERPALRDELSGGRALLSIDEYAARVLAESGFSPQDGPRGVAGALTADVTTA